MTKKKWTEEERAAFGAKMRAAKQAKLDRPPTDPPVSSSVEATPPVDEQKPQGYGAMQAQIDEIMETNALLKAAVLGQKGGSGPQIGNQGVIGEVDRYLIDSNDYPDPTPRLAAEPKLVQAVNFPYNYELQYKFDISKYQTKAGVNMREPKFMVQLNRIVLNDQGEQTDKRYVARRLIFHEDPQAALIVARENHLDVDTADQRTFLNEMRYLRVRDWLFDIFWPKPPTPNDGIHEEVIGGTLVQVFTKSSEDPSEIPFDKLNTKLV